jgi:hypothetical protein
MIGYMDKGIPEVRYNPAIKKDLVMVSIPGLKDAFFAGIDKFLIDSYSNKIKTPVVEERLKNLYYIYQAAQANNRLKLTAHLANFLSARSLD